MNNIYLDILNTSQKFCNAVNERKSLPAVHYLSEFYNKSEEINPSVARMALQEALTNTYAEHAANYFDGTIDVSEYREKIRSHVALTKTINRDTRMGDLEHSIREIYPKTYKKRLAIIPCLMDMQDKLSAVRKNVCNPNAVVESKAMKKFQYFMRALFTK